MNATIDFSELIYDRMICNPMAVPPKRSPEDFYPLFSQYKEFTEKTPGVDRNKLFRYIPLVYDKNSPLHLVIDDIRKVKGKAAELAGFKKVKGEYVKSVQDVLKCQDKVVNAMIVRYIVEHKSNKYERFCILREVFTNISNRLLAGEDDKRDLPSFNTLGDEIDTIRQDLLSKDNSVNLEESLIEYYFEDRLRLRPEDIAKNKRDGKEPLE